MFKIVHPSGGYTSVSNNFSSLTMGTLRNDSLQNLQHLTYRKSRSTKEQRGEDKQGRAKTTT